MSQIGRSKKRLHYEVIAAAEQFARLWMRTRPAVTSGRIQAAFTIGSAVVWVNDRYSLL